MPHHRNRQIKTLIQKALRLSPLVGLLGQRQVGKTTLLEEFVKENYITFDEGDLLLFAERSPKSFLAQFTSLTALDECQKVPALFPALKERVRLNKRPGQFLLSGSVRFTSRKMIQESLTGRILSFELLPMTLAEIQGLEPLNYFEWFEKDFNTLKTKLSARLEFLAPNKSKKYLTQGGLPGICFIRDKANYRLKMNSHIETLLQRDIHLVSNSTVAYSSLILLLGHIAKNQGSPFVLKEASKQCRLTQNTVKKLLEAFEALFLIRRIPGFGFRTGPEFYLEDQGMAHFLEPLSSTNELTRWTFSQVFGNTHYALMNDYRIGYSENKSGLKINVVIESQNQRIGFIFENSEIPSAHTLRTAQSFLNESKQNYVILLTASGHFQKHSKNFISLPIGAIA